MFAAVGEPVPVREAVNVPVSVAFPNASVTTATTTPVFEGSIVGRVTVPMSYAVPAVPVM
jgi:hypothetical protein